MSFRASEARPGIQDFQVFLDSHWFRFCPMLTYLSTFLHPLAPRALPRFLATTGALTPARPALRPLSGAMNTRPIPGRSPWFTPRDLPCIPSPNTWRALPSLLRCPPSVTGSLGLRPGLDFTLNPQARRYARPNRVRYPTDCMFASGCSPPRLAATQLPSATRERASPGKGTFTPQIAPAPRRTDSGFRRNDGSNDFCKNLIHLAI